MSIEKVRKMIVDEEVAFVDLRFCDTTGKEQHVTMPVSMADEDFFEEGKMFDGSSIKGWKGINESDMVLMPDVGTAIIDPFMEHNTLVLRCDVLEPDTMEGYNRCPRSLAKRAEAYMQSSGIADVAYFGPEPEFFVFDSVSFGTDMHSTFYKIDSEEGAWNTGRNMKKATMATVRVSRVDISRFHRSIACMTCVPGSVKFLKIWVCRLKFITTKWAPPASVKSAPNSIR